MKTKRGSIMNSDYSNSWLALLFFCLIAIGSNAQKVAIQGIVINPENEAIELANVVAYSTIDSSLISFAITDYEGRFNLDLEKDSVYLLKIIYLGYEERSEVFRAGEEAKAMIFQLKPALKTLEEITVVYKMPVVVRGDTVSFRAESFTNGKERKLKEVFEKLPGFEVEENGSVKVNGEKVNKITIDGKEFFTGDTKMATTNIPANVVDKVNVLRNHSDVRPMRDLEGEGNLTIDISLKADKQNITFGSAEAGGGLENRFLGHLNVFHFGKKASINFIGNANNVAEQVFTFQDMLRFNGGFEGMASKNGASTRLSSESLGLMPMRDNKAQHTNAKVAALNFTFNPGNKLKFSGFSIVTDLENDLLNQANRTYIGLESANNNERLSSGIQQRTLSGILKLNTKCIPNDNLHIEHNLMLRATQLNKSENLLSENAFENRYFDTDDLVQTPSVFQNLSMFYTLAPRHLISFEASQDYQYQRNRFDLNSTEDIYSGIIPAVITDTVRLMQDQNLNTHKIDAALTYYFLLNNTNHIGLSVGSVLNKQGLFSELGQGISNEEEIKFTQPDLQNDVDYWYRDIYAGIYYKTILTKLTFKPGIYLHDFYLNTEQSGREEVIRKQLLLPNINLKYNFKRTESLTLDYRIQTEFYDIQQYAQGSILRNYNQLFRGNPTLENSWYHTVQLDYYSLNLFNFTNIYGVFNYQRRYDNLNNRVVFEQLDRITNPLNIPQPNDMLTFYGAIDKRFKKFKAALSANLNYGNFNNVLANDIIVENKNFTQTYSGSVETTMDNFPVLELGFRTMINRYWNDGIGTQVFTNNRPFGNIEISFLKHFILLVDYEYNWYTNQSTNSSNTYDILNAELYFRKGDSPFEFRLSALNVLDTRSIRQDNFSDILISTNEYFIQKRYFLMTVKYEF